MAPPSHDHHVVIRPVRTRFEPSHLAPACLVEAYTRLVPQRRRARPPLPSPDDRVAGNGREPARSSGRQAKEGQQCS
jgi:hypothetical protein